MSTLKLGINGFGRIGCMVLRASLQNDNVEVQKGIIVRLPKNNSKIETKEFSIEKLTLGFDQFRLFREAYDKNAIIERCFRKEN